MAPSSPSMGTSFEAAPGRLVGFLGANGAGKTTTMRCIFGLVRPDAGEVRWKGDVITPSHRLRFGYMPEQRGLYPRMRVGEQLAYFAAQHGMTDRDARDAASRWLDRLGLADRERSKLEDLSHGNQQRVQLAAALVHDPELLVLDEPFSGLDPIGVATMSEVLHECVDAGTTVLFSSHQLDLVEDICEDVVIIGRGRLVAAGPIGELRAQAGRRHLEVEVVGGSERWLPAAGHTILERAGDRVRLLVDESADLEGLLAAALAAGDVRRFSYEPPRLSEIFLEAIATTAPDAPGTAEGGLTGPVR
jgi:ABC-2 type transport system ATP-binding protein